MIKEIYISLLFLLASYTMLQIVRHELIHKIQETWIKNRNDLYNKYSYDFMFNPSRHNWFGLLIPREKHFK